MTENAMEARFRLDLGGGETDALPIGFADRRDEERLAELLGTGDQLRVRLTPATDVDTEGHVIRWGELLVRLQPIEGDDTEGHAISLRFPSADEASRFRTRLLTTGALVGTLVVGGVALQSLPSSSLAGPQAGNAPAVGADAANAMVEGGRRDAGAAIGTQATGADAANAMVEGGRRDAGAPAAPAAGGTEDDEQIDRSGRTGPQIR